MNRLEVIILIIVTIIGIIGLILYFNTSNTGMLGLEEGRIKDYKGAPLGKADPDITVREGYTSYSKGYMPEGRAIQNVGEQRFIGLNYHGIPPKVQPRKGRIASMGHARCPNGYRLMHWQAAKEDCIPVNNPEYDYSEVCCPTSTY
jgi:hypothetical protein